MTARVLNLSFFYLLQHIILREKLQDNINISSKISCKNKTVSNIYQK